MNNQEKLREGWRGISRATAGIMICLLFFHALQVWAQTVSLDELVSRTQDRYEKTQDLKAKFMQEIHIKSMNRVEREEGIVYIKNPKRMLWHYTRPKVKKLFITPQGAWLYIPQDRVVYMQSLENMYRSKLAVRFLSGIEKLRDDFHISFSKPDPVDSRGNYLITLIPKESDPGVNTLFLTIDKESYQVTKCSFSDLYGNVNRIQFTEITINSMLSEKLFNFKPPPGTEVFKMP
ncbi:MAG: outer membrane lipoprotein carrier protein LolA [Deltaproteobacteria bacterium]|nr:outer membrane lipoprotein carrier protein LolA [Deltaproteobacteria bacterium]